jgi:hypothetical protein
MMELLKKMNIPSAHHFKRFFHLADCKNNAPAAQSINQKNGDNRNSNALDRMKNIGQI